MYTTNQEIIEEFNKQNPMEDIQTIDDAVVVLRRANWKGTDAEIAIEFIAEEKDKQHKEEMEAARAAGIIVGINKIPHAKNGKLIKEVVDEFNLN